MKRLFTKLVACVAVVTLVATMGMTAFAHTEMDNMEFVGYYINKENPEDARAVYNEVIDGSFTNKHLFVPVEPEWVNEGEFEKVYPYAGYDTMYLEGNRQDNIHRYNNLFPQWESRRQDFFWEVKKPHIIWERQQTNVPGQGWTWDFGNEKFGIEDSVVLTETIKEAVVVNEEMIPYGFGWYNNQGEILSLEEQAMYQNFSYEFINGISTIYEAAIANDVVMPLINEDGSINAEYFEVSHDRVELIPFDYQAGADKVAPAALSVEVLSARDPWTGKYIVTDEMLATAIPTVYSNYITAKFNEVNNDGLATKDVADEYLAHGEDWEWDRLATFAIGASEISWTAPTFEMAEPYDQFQYLIVNGVVLDGEDGKDRVLRYTGGKADPEITWEFEFFQVSDVPTAAGAIPADVFFEIDEDGNWVRDINPVGTVFELVERKYVDGVPAVDADGNPVYRIPTGVYGNTYFKFDTREKDGVDVPVLDLYVTAEGHDIYLGSVERWEGTIASFIDAYITGSINLVTFVEQDPAAN